MSDLLPISCRSPSWSAGSAPCRVSSSWIACICSLSVTAVVNAGATSSGLSSPDGDGVPLLSLCKTSAVARTVVGGMSGTFGEGLVAVVL